jgi:hypothetical protein
MKKDSIKDMAKVQSTYVKGVKAVKKVGGAQAARKLLAKKAK